MQVDILAIGVHPDDIELCCSGTLAAEIAAGARVGLLDLTEGELGTNGNVETRRAEAKNALKILGADWRINLGMRDGFFELNEAHILPIARIIRLCRPEIVLCNAPSDRHPDHGRAARLIYEASFYSGLSKITLHDDLGNELERFRPHLTLNYIQDHFHQPDLVIDISAHFKSKIASLQAYATQFSAPGDNKNLISTPISGNDFWLFVEARAREMGRLIGVEFGEGFLCAVPLKFNSLYKQLKYPYSSNI